MKCNTGLKLVKSLSFSKEFKIEASDALNCILTMLLFYLKRYFDEIIVSGNPTV